MNESSPSKPSLPEDAPSFETKLAELETLVEALESGDLELAESLERFKRGVTLSQDCRAMLDTAQQQVETLMGSDVSLDDAESDETSG